MATGASVVFGAHTGDLAGTGFYLLFVKEQTEPMAEAIEEILGLEPTGDAYSVTVHPVYEAGNTDLKELMYKEVISEELSEERFNNMIAITKKYLPYGAEEVMTRLMCTVLEPGQIHPSLREVTLWTS